MERARVAAERRNHNQPRLRCSEPIAPWQLQTPVRSLIMKGMKVVAALVDWHDPRGYNLMSPKQVSINIAQPDHRGSLFALRLRTGSILLTRWATISISGSRIF